MCGHSLGIIFSYLTINCEQITSKEIKLRKRESISKWTQSISQSKNWDEWGGYIDLLMLVSEKVLCLYIQQLPSMTSQKSIVCCDGHNVLPVVYCTKLRYFLIGSWNIFSNCLDDIRTDSPWILLQEEGIDFLSHVCYLIWRLSKHLHSSTRDLRLPTAVTMSFYHWWWVLSRNEN